MISDGGKIGSSDRCREGNSRLHARDARGSSPRITTPNTSSAWTAARFWKRTSWPNARNPRSPRRRSPIRTAAPEPDQSNPLRRVPLRRLDGSAHAELFGQAQHVFARKRRRGAVRLPAPAARAGIRRPRKLASRSVRSRPARSRNCTKPVCARPTITPRPSTKNFVSTVSLWRVAMPFHRWEKRTW